MGAEQPFPRRSRRLNRTDLLLIVISVVVAALLALSGGLVPLKHLTRSAEFALREQPASGDLVVVEMDAASIAAINRWPFPRHHYAAVIDELHRAGATSIVFDVDFSSPSNVSDDAMLAAAVERAGGRVVLPTFTQSADHRGSRRIDALPIAPLRAHATMAAVSVDPDGDGIVRNMLLGTMTAGTPRPSLSAYIAHRSGRADEQFPIDYSIRPDTIPRLSFIDVERGRFDPASVRGKDILIGATAIEMGDRYAVPRYGVLPGVVVQALAAETLYDGVPFSAGWVVPLLLALLVALAVVRRRTIRATLALASGGIVTFFAMAMASWNLLGIIFDIVPAAVGLVVASTGGAVRIFHHRLQHRRLHDPETGLLNRNALHRCAAATSHTLIVAGLIDGYDRLAAVLGNDGMGFLVSRIADRLALATDGAAIFRTEDRVLAWTTEDDRYEIEERLSALVRVMRSPIEVGGRRVDVSLSFGIAEQHAIAEATLAASEAHAANAPWHYHAATERAVLDREVSLMGELDAAIEAGEIHVVYQPKLEIATGAISSVEALVRWDHPERGFLRPDLFIPLAEQSDRIEALTLYVLDRSIRDIGAWSARGLDIMAAVNISARLVTSSTFIAATEALLDRSPVPNDRLIFEVTESAAIADQAAAAAALRKFRDLGIAISMDDYGTGQSTLTYLKQLPLSELKIDRSFVQFAHQNQSDAVLVRSTIELAHELGLKVVAEGVEDEECLAFLRAVNCDYAQGYLIGKPMAAGDLATLASAERRYAA